MATPRFHLPTIVGTVGDEIALPDDVAHHALRVRRLREGDAITLFTGEGGEYAATLTRVGKREALVRIDAFVDAQRESPLSLTLVQAIVASDVMDAIVRHAVELGVTAIDPVVSARSARFPDGVQGEKRLAHWRQIVVAACEQCGRNTLPVVADVAPLAQWCDRRDRARRGIVLDPQSDRDLHALPKPTTGVEVLVGPEGGFTDEEVARTVRADLARVRLGPRVLRAETAALAALTAVNFSWGDLR